MKICNMCGNVSTDLLISIRNNIEAILEVRSQEIMKGSILDTNCCKDFQTLGLEGLTFCGYCGKKMVMEKEGAFSIFYFLFLQRYLLTVILVNL